MPASFRAPFQNAGVDGDLSPHAGMIIPRGHGTSNYFSLADGAGYRFDHPAGLDITEVKKVSSSLMPIAEVMLAISGMTATPDFLAWPTFKVTVVGKSAPPRTGWSINAVNPRTKKGEATLDVGILGERRVKLAIRPVQIPDPTTGTPVFHSKKPFDISALVATMNEIWTPQANVVFDLVSSAPVLVDEGAEIAKILGLRTATTAPLPSIVDEPKFKDLFNRKKEPSADLTMFLVEQAADTDPKATRPHAVAGVTDPILGISLISDDRTLQPELLAHEAGHFLGTHGSFIYKHPTTDPKALMRDGGSAVAKISFSDTVQHFNRT